VGSDSGDGTRRITKKSLYAAGLILTVITTIPAVAAYFIVKEITDSKFTGLMVSVIVFFISMGFSVKVSKKINLIK
jgi:uncharacterized membrane protein